MVSQSKTIRASSTKIRSKVKPRLDLKGTPSAVKKLQEIYSKEYNKTDSIFQNLQAAISEFTAVANGKVQSMKLRNAPSLERNKLKALITDFHATEEKYEDCAGKVTIKEISKAQKIASSHERIPVEMGFSTDYRMTDAEAAKQLKGSIDALRATVKLYASELKEINALIVKVKALK